MKQWPMKILKYLTGFLILSSVHCTVVALALARDRGTFLYSLVYIPIVILLVEGQKRSRHLWQFLVWALAACGVAQLLGRSIFERKLSIIITLVAVVFYFYARAKKTECLLDTPGYAFLLLYIVIYFLERQYPSRLLENYAIIGAGLYLLLCMYKTNLDEMLQVFDVNEKLERFPEKRLIKNNLIMMGIQTVFVVTGMFAAMFVGVDGVMDSFRNLLAKFVRWIIAILESIKTPEVENTIEGEKQMFVIEAGETSVFMEFLLKLIDILMTVAVILIVLYGIYQILKKLYQLYVDFDSNVSENGDKIEKLYTVQTKEEKRQLRKTRSERLFWDRTPDARIRKHYKKWVMKELGSAPKKFMTPKEIQQEIQADADKKALMHKYYEKARYAEKECTKEEMERYLKV